VTQPATPHPPRGRVVVLFRAGLGLIYLAAFLSLAVQLVDLAGAHGLLSLTQALDRLRQVEPSVIGRWLDFPTLLWIDPSDTALRILPLAGALLAVTLLLGRGGRAVPILLWVLYLSCITAGRDFFYYQWDNLLLEAGLLAVFLPARGTPLDLWRGRPLPEPSPVVVYLFRWLLFRLLFESGLAKIIFGWDDWFKLVGMSFYYETAPLPSWGGWLVQQAPLWFHRMSVWFTMLVELPLACCVFLGPRWRRAFFLIHLPFQLSIALTANYGFFNLLAIALSLLVLDDRDLDAAARLARRLLRRPPAAPRPAPVAAPPLAAGRPALRARRVLPWLLAALLVPASLAEASGFFLRGWGINDALRPLRALSAAFRSVNVYHLFPGIVRERVVAEIEGSDDGLVWHPYHLRYAPGNPTVAPPMTWLHNPRFPFHYSFLTLGRGGRDQEYLQNLVQRLCCDPRAVGDLFADDPFRDHGPRELRMRFYRYRFGTWSDLQTDGVYWRRDPRGASSPYQCRCDR
jgi:Lipase maturation factor